jgi:hypothetical protein|tara:strand:+ start:5956 stop:6330 length:375 start_codon:yes stop_codon:yes gene_type:complete
MHLHTLVNALQIKKSILSKELDPRWLKFMPGWQEIPDNIQASRELYKNLFQAPIVFLIFCLFAYVLNNVSTFNVVLAWMYVALRIWHYYVRITNPKISKRRIPFQYSLIISLVLWIDLFVFLLK